MGTSDTDKLALPGIKEVWITAASDPVVKAQVDAEAVARDGVLAWLWWFLKCIAISVPIAIVVCCVAQYVLAFSDTYQAELQAKRDAKTLYELHCQATGLSVAILHECVRAKTVLERGTWLSAHEHAVHNCLDIIPGVPYCRAHPDMCALGFMKLIELLTIFFSWGPCLVGCAIFYYGAWPWLIGVFLHRIQNLTSSNPQNAKKAV